MKTLYEVTRPIIERVALDGKIDIAIEYAYDLYRDDIRTMFDKGNVLAAWRTRLLLASIETTSWDELLRRMMLAQGEIESVHHSFYDRLARSSLTYQVNSQQSLDYSELLFDELLGHKLLDDTHNEIARNYATAMAWAVELVLHLDDTTSTFTTEDVDHFTYWVREVLTFVNPSEPVTLNA